MNFDHIKNIEELQQELNRQKDIINRTPREDFDNLCPLDMYNLLYHPFESVCILQFNSKNGTVAADKMPFMQLVIMLLERVAQAGELKLTAKGNLPTKLVKELYDSGALKDRMVEDGYQKVYKESDITFIANIKIICNLAGITKIRNKKLSLTKKGHELFQPKNRFALFQNIFTTYGYKFNLGYHDGYQIEGSVQSTLSYTLYQLLKNGHQERESAFYAKKALRAYPHILAEVPPTTYSTPESSFIDCHALRIMQRFLAWFNLIEVRKDKVHGQYRKKLYVKNDLLPQVMFVDKQKFLFSKSPNQS